MQQTRLNLLFTRFINQFRNFAANPWRKLSLIIIFCLIGFSLPTILTSSISQGGDWDATVALVFLIFTESLNRLIFGGKKGYNTPKPWWKDLLYSFKIGFVYGLYLDGVILTS